MSDHSTWYSKANAPSRHDSSGGSFGSSNHRTGQDRFDGRPNSPLLERFGEHSSNFASRREFIGAPPPAFTRPREFCLTGGATNRWYSGTSLSLQCDGFRFGYFQYNRNFRDNWFFFGNYCYAPTFAGAYCSPWYYYSELPPYFYGPSVIIVEDYPYRHSHYGAREYDYRYDGEYRHDPYSIDSSIDAIVSGFEHEDFRALDFLAPHDGDVAIFMDHQYRYSIHSDEFFDMLRDAVDNVHTSAYHILDVRTYDDDSVRIEARHETVDPWGRHSNVYNTFLLQKESDGYVIREFGTSHNRD